MNSKKALNILNQNNILNNIIVEEGYFNFPDKKKSNLKEDKEQIIINSKFKLNFIAGCISFDAKVSFINCIFDSTAMFHGAVFEKKAIFRNCKFNSISEFSSTYFLDKTFFENCYFSNFLSFSGSQFDKELIFKNNYLKKGSDLLGNLDKPYKVLFKKETFIERNTGNLELNT